MNACRVLKVLSVLLFISALSIGNNGMNKAVASNMVIQVYVDDQQVVFGDAEPYLDDNSRTLVPVRFPVEALGATVTWEQANEQVTITKGENIVILTSNSAGYLVNGQWRQMDTAMVYNRELGRNFVPLRFVMEGLGASVAWEQTVEVAKIIVKTTLETEVPKEEMQLAAAIEADKIVVDKFKVFIDSGHGVNHTQGDYYLFPPGMEQFFKDNDLIYKRPSHYNFSTGAAGEMQINWLVGNYLQLLLLNDPRFEVMRDREQFADFALANQERIQKANQWGADLIISLHAEKTSSKGGYFAVMPGEEYVFPEELGGYYNQTVRAGSEKFAEIWLEALDRAELGWGRLREGYYRYASGYIVHRWAKAPIVLIEMDSNKSWANSIDVRTNQIKFAHATYMAILNNFKLSALQEDHQLTIQELEYLVPNLKLPEVNLKENPYK